MVKHERQSQKQDRRIGLGWWCLLYARWDTWDKSRRKQPRKLGHLVTFGSDRQDLVRGNLGPRDARSRPSLDERPSGTKRGWLLVEAPSMHLTVLRTSRCGGGGSLVPRTPSHLEDELRTQAGHRGKGILRVPQLDARASVHRGPSSKLHPSLATGG